MYREYLIEYDNDALMVYLSGLDEDDFWIFIRQWEDVDNVESFAEGYAESLREQGETVQVIPVEVIE